MIWCDFYSNILFILFCEKTIIDPVGSGVISPEQFNSLFCFGTLQNNNYIKYLQTLEHGGERLDGVQCIWINKRG